MKEFQQYCSAAAVIGIGLEVSFSFLSFKVIIGRRIQAFALIRCRSSSHDAWPCTQHSRYEIEPIRRDFFPPPRIFFLLWILGNRVSSNMISTIRRKKAAGVTIWVLFSAQHGSSSFISILHHIRTIQIPCLRLSFFRFPFQISTLIRSGSRRLSSFPKRGTGSSPVS